ncbi:copper transporter [Rhodococcus sp. TAF43]|uniref:copper transporter n=1 Tax=unclassified Rhodococcus (in: high G+C Gram-positive bacteria) TaxID=192944 RepID=UPI000E0B7907|nr:MULTISPECIES: copper transporter [unclassified Rhodococcus (in: high G+C Gram-positive bacteria)]QKT11784.1 copper transporter [Rhodococcus sp. W8901]
MISMRQHAISIAAIFLALAIGVVLGSGLLSNGMLSGLRDDKAELQNEIEDLNQENNQLGEQLMSADGFDSAVADRIVRDTLAQRSVILVTTPDADPADIDGINRVVAQAGGAITGRVSLTKSFVDSVNGDQLRTTVTNIIPAGIQLRTGAVDQGSLAGDLLGSVLLLNPQTAQPQTTPEERGLALETLRGGGFIDYDGNVQPAQLAVVLTGEGDPENTGGNRGAVIARFAGALDGRGAGTVLAGPPAAAEGSGPIAVARADAAVSAVLTTVDNVDRESGRITTVLALQEQLGGGSGRYGTGPGATAVTVGAPTP